METQSILSPFFLSPSLLSIPLSIPSLYLSLFLSLLSISLLSIPSLSLPLAPYPLSHSLHSPSTLPLPIPLPIPLSLPSLPIPLSPLSPSGELRGKLQPQSRRGQYRQAEADGHRLHFPDRLPPLSERTPLRKGKARRMVGGAVGASGVVESVTVGSGGAEWVAVGGCWLGRMLAQTAASLTCTS